MGQEFIQWCRQMGIRKTTTAAHDSNANASAENAVGMLKRRGWYLLNGARIPTDYGGMAVLAAADLLRAEAGHIPFPTINFGTRIMVVDEVKPRNSFAVRAQRATIFGQCQHVPNA